MVRISLCKLMTVKWGNYVILCGRPEMAIKIQQMGLEDFSSKLWNFLSCASYSVHFLGKHSQVAGFGPENTNVTVVSQTESLARETTLCLMC